MARTPSALTLAIRKLCDETKGDITHNEARPRLTKLGFPMVPQPPEKSELLSKWEAAAAKVRRKPNPEDQSAVKVYNENVAARAGLNPGQVKAVLHEIAQRRAYEVERNNFDVTKYNWTKAQMKASRKPESKTTVKVKVAKRTPTRTAVRPAAAAAAKPAAPIDVAAALTEVEKLGGVKGVQARIDQLNADIADLQKKAATAVATAQAEIDHLDGLRSAVEELSKRVKAAA